MDIDRYIIPESSSTFAFSSIRIYRNFANTRFSNYADKEELEYIENSVNAVLSKDNNIYKKIKTNKLSKNEIENLKDNILINKNIKDKTIYLSDNKTIVVNLNEHITLQMITTNSKKLVQIYKEIKNEENKLSAYIDFAFDSELGFLTSTPRKVGCSMSILVAFTTPNILSFAPNLIKSIENKLKEYGFILKLKNNILYIRNKYMIGLTEKDILKRVCKISRYIIKTEEKIEQRLFTNSSLKIKLEDKIFRSYSILTNARLLTYKEAIKYLMWINVGNHLSILKIDNEKIYKLMFMVKTSQVKIHYNNEINNKNIKECRAKLVQDYLAVGE